ncbi:MAG: phage holin family protein [Thermoleophilia bacterium]
MSLHDEGLRERSTGDLVKELTREVSTLVRQEVELARAEVGQKARTTGIGLGMFGGAAVAALLALGALTALAILALDEAMPAWAAALIVTAVWAAIAGVLALRGRDKVKEGGAPVPSETIEQAKEDVRWVRSHTRSDSR